MPIRYPRCIGQEDSPVSNTRLTFVLVSNTHLLLQHMCVDVCFVMITFKVECRCFRPVTSSFTVEPRCFPLKTKINTFSEKVTDLSYERCQKFDRRLLTALKYPYICGPVIIVLTLTSTGGHADCIHRNITTELTFSCCRNTQLKTK